MTARLAILGAGVKAVAVAAKAATLRDMGVATPEIVAVERTAVASNWRAGGGWTDGQHRLGTSPATSRQTFLQPVSLYGPGFGPPVGLPFTFQFGARVDF